MDKKRLKEIMIFGLLIMITSSILDIIGVDFMLWGYPNMILPLAPPIVFDNYATLPPVFSLIYQYSRNWRSFIIATLVMAGAFAFIVEPVLVWAKIYDLHNWHYAYSFLIYIVMGIATKAIVDKIDKISAA